MLEVEYGRKYYLFERSYQILIKNKMMERPKINVEVLDILFLVSS